VRAAEYVRMSTDHQQYSTQNQSAAIRQYAAQRGIEVVRTYVDAGKSGLTADRRDGLQQLIADVQGKTADFTTILVYDVSRWGRFQDADESAYYEYICRRAGISVHYCAEQFENDGSPISTIVKGLKRVMAGEYSRDLSLKVFAAQCRLVKLGFNQGGAAGYGLRRRAIDKYGVIRTDLDRGQHKYIHTDRVVLAPGRPGEVKTVRWIFRSYVEDRKSLVEIARILSRRDKELTGARWYPERIREILCNEKYIGNNIWNRFSSRLRKREVRNDRDAWVRANGCFEPVVDKAIFDAAQIRIQNRWKSWSDERMLDGLRQLLRERGYLTRAAIDAAKHLPCSDAYQRRFGSILSAYARIGYAPPYCHRVVQGNRVLRRTYPQIMAHAIAGIREGRRLGQARPGHRPSQHQRRAYGVHRHRPMPNNTGRLPALAHAP
jgi:DNA invertase Pin-like site-specific DNA recombinase